MGYALQEFQVVDLVAHNSARRWRPWWLIDMKKLLCLIISGAMLGIVVRAGATNEASSGAVIEAKIEGALPKLWTVVERKTGSIPEGHYWGQEYSGVHGEEILIQGSADVHVLWQDSNGEWHTDAVGKEALKLYVMPSSYRESLLRFLIPKRPVTAPLLFEGQAFKVYAYPSFRILEKEKLDRIVKQGKAIRWPDSPENTQTLTWGSWGDDIRRLLDGI